MTLVSQIINDAYRESNLIALGTAPTGEQTDEGLTLLNRIVKSVYGMEAGDQLNSIPIGRNNILQPSGWPYYNGVPAVTNWVVPLNARLLLNLQAAQTVYLHPAPQDGSRFAVLDKSSDLATYNLTVYGNGQTIDNAVNAVFNINGTNTQYLYRADTGNWAKVSPLVTTDDMPFPEEFDDFFVIMLAIRLDPRYETALSSESLAAFKRSDKQFKARYRQVIQMGSESALQLTSGARPYRYWSYGNPTDQFNAGIVYGPFLSF